MKNEEEAEHRNFINNFEICWYIWAKSNADEEKIFHEKKEMERVEFRVKYKLSAVSCETHKSCVKQAGFRGKR